MNLATKSDFLFSTFANSNLILRQIGRNSPTDKTWLGVIKMLSTPSKIGSTNTK